MPDYPNFAGKALFKDVTEPASPDSGNLAVYSESGVLKTKTSGGTVTSLGAAGVGGSTGATDNAILRADGAGAATVQNSALNIDDGTTATQANVAITNQHSETNSALVLTPKGTGAFIVGPKPDGTSTGGNARGTRAICMVTNRSGATQVASGNESVAIGNQAIANSLQAIAIGGATASGAYSVAIGLGAIASNSASCAIGGQDNNATSPRSFVIGYGGRGDRQTTFAHGIQPFAANGDAQTIRAVLRAKTTTNSAVEFFIDGSSVRLTVPSGKIMAMLINITGAKSDGSAVAHYLRQYCIKNVAGTTSEVYAPVTIGTDNAASTSISITANDTNDALKIEATGIASETWRWVASVDAVEVAYGT